MYGRRIVLGKVTLVCVWFRLCVLSCRPDVGCTGARCCVRVMFKILVIRLRLFRRVCRCVLIVLNLFIWVCLMVTLVLFRLTLRVMFRGCRCLMNVLMWYRRRSRWCPWTWCRSWCRVVMVFRFMSRRRVILTWCSVNRLRRALSLARVLLRLLWNLVSFWMGRGRRLIVFRGGR